MPQEICFKTFSDEEFIEALRDRRHSVVAEAVGVSHVTIGKLAKGKTDGISLQLRAKVTEYFEGGDNAKS